MEHSGAHSSNKGSSSASTVSRRLLSIPSNAGTYVPMTVEELSLVQAPSSWTSANVRCIGYLVDKDSGVILHSCAEAGGKFEINVDLSLMQKEPPRNTAIQLFGEICVDENAVPFIKGCFYRNFESVDLVMYNEALDMISSFFPLNVNRSAKEPSCEDEVEKEACLPDH